MSTSVGISVTQPLRFSQKLFWRVLFSISCITLLTALSIGDAVGQDAPPAASQATFDQALAAGEFGLADGMIDAVAENDGARRVELTRQLADAQRRSGAFHQATQTMLRNYLPNQAAGGYEYQTGYGESNPNIPAVNSAPHGNAGGGSIANFSQLINLIQSTVAPESWGLESTIMPFQGGVYVDPSGAMRRVVQDGNFNEPLQGFDHTQSGDASWQSGTELRHISLTRLNLALQERIADGLPITEEMHYLSGLNRIDYVYWHPQSGELVIAGPAGKIADGAFRYKIDPESGRACVLLEDVATVLGSILRRESAFGVSLAPTADGLVRIKSMLSSSREMREFARRPAPWTEKLAATLGPQEVDIFGVPAASATAIALLEADEHMKRLGLGLADPVRDVTSYPDTVAKLDLEFDGRMIRWWFAASDDLIKTNADHTAFKIPEHSVQLLTEDQWMNATGQRSGTGKIDLAAEKFAKDFTAEFKNVAIRYPFYQRLKNVFDLGTGLELARSGVGMSEPKQLSLDAIVEWGTLTNSQVPVARTSETIAAWRKIGKNRLIAMVSGGVRVPLRGFHVATDDVDDRYSKVSMITLNSSPELVAFDHWWWNGTPPRP